MKKSVLSLLLFYSFQSLFGQSSEIISKGVVFFKTEASFVLPENLTLFNKDGSLYVSLKKQNDVLEILYSIPPYNLKHNLTLKRLYPYYYLENCKYNAPIPKIILRAYYPDFGVFVMDANKISDIEYEVFVNGEWKKIRNRDLSYSDWSDFIKHLLIKLPSNVQLYSKRNSKSKKMFSHADISFKVLEVKGDWIKIECNSSCEDCMIGEKITGWVRWKLENNILVDLYYVC